MKIKFWGTRGSIPAPGAGTVKVGGNTTCLQVVTKSGDIIIVDAGTGMRPLGLSLIKSADPPPLTLLLTHSHWDHLAGFTFFPPAYSPAHRISVYGNKMAIGVLKRDIFERHDNRYFPVNMDNFRAEIEFYEELPKPFRVGNMTIDSMSLNHPGNGYAYKFTEDNRSVTFITDNELGKDYEGGNTRAEIEDFCHQTDVLIHDAQYLNSEIQNHVGWGHSTYGEVAELAQAANIHRVYFTHHDPERDDDGCDALLAEARNYIAERKYEIDCNLAIEGDSIEL